ncbi:hypothetical protein LCGC14_1331810 [marine sediment metagenome]|uniref:site-specific DNA-methyltransferase (cytosine-N(4)-specific) n=1 Tax=marine sediment metagenome TaxID=412755 RepID=A0A0F9KG94_9ZZZZ
MLKPYYETKLGKLYHGDCLDIMPQLEPVDLVVTSPPYDNLRQYEGYTFDFIGTAKAVSKLLKPGATLVWIVGDETINGDESGTSFTQALYYKSLGLRLLDTMIYEAKGTGAKGSNNAYWQAFEYMFVLTNGKIKTVNRIKDHRNITQGQIRKSTPKSERIGTRTIGDKVFTTPPFSIRTNIWKYSTGKDGVINHPATFPEQLAQDHIISWSNEGNTVADIMMGSGTTAIACERLNRKWVGIETSELYCEEAASRIEREVKVLSKRLGVAATFRKQASIKKLRT